MFTVFTYHPVFPHFNTLLNINKGGGLCPRSHGGLRPPCEKPSIRERGGRENTNKQWWPIGKED